MEKLSSSESLFMKVIWEADHELSVTELMSILDKKYGKDYKRTSVQTFLMKMELKGFITTRREGKNSVVVTRITEGDYLAYMSERDLKFWYQDDLSLYISMLCRTRKLQPEEKERIRRLLDDSTDL
jgi:predicted transcriptional regulator